MNAIEKTIRKRSPEPDLIDRNYEKKKNGGEVACYKIIMMIGLYYPLSIGLTFYQKWFIKVEFFQISKLTRIKTIEEYIYSFLIGKSNYQNRIEFSEFFENCSTSELKFKNKIMN